MADPHKAEFRKLQKSIFVANPIQLNLAGINARNPNSWTDLRPGLDLGAGNRGPAMGAPPAEGGYFGDLVD